MGESLRFEWVDVFTDRPYAGNPLAVFVEPGDLTAERMQAIARELNLSETTFVCEPGLEGADFRVRIFTPQRELPMAGHPTLGTAHVLAGLGRIARRGDRSRVVFEEGVGPIPVEIAWEGDRPGRIVMTQPQPTFGRVLEERSEVAGLLSLDRSDLAELPIRVVSTGPPILFVPLGSLAAVADATLDLAAWQGLLAGTDAETIFLFSLETADPSADVHGRLFAPAFGIPEDPATGGAAGPLGAYLVHEGVMGRRGRARIAIEQGLEMGRPSRLEVEVERDEEREGGEWTIRVGGRCARVARGELLPPG
jgi:trans-2,3-dihydro-3-hydroxyanthranilate isomerase